MIYLILDKPNPDSDRRLAQHLVSLYHIDADEEQINRENGLGGNNNNRIVSQKFLRDYIYYCRHNVRINI